MVFKISVILCSGIESMSVPTDRFSSFRPPVLDTCAVTYRSVFRGSWLACTLPQIARTGGPDLWSRRGVECHSSRALFG